MDGGVDEHGRIERQEPLDARRKAGLQLVHARLDLLRHFERVRARRQQHTEAGDRLVVEPHVERIACRPSSTRATSLSRTLVPLGSVRRMTFSNSSMELKRPSAVTEAITCWPGNDGRAPSEPVANCTFCPRTRSSTSGGAHAEAAQLVGIQPDAHRIFGAELRRVWPTPGMRAIGSSTCEATMLLSSSEGTLLSFERIATAMRKSELTLATVRPCSTTSRGRRGSASVDAVLRLHRRDVRIRAGLEEQRDAAAAVRGRRGEIHQVVDAGELLLDDLRDGAFDRVGIGARVASR